LDTLLELLECYSNLKINGHIMTVYIIKESNRVEEIRKNMQQIRKKNYHEKN